MAHAIRRLRLSSSSAQMHYELEKRPQLFTRRFRFYYDAGWRVVAGQLKGLANCLKLMNAKLTCAATLLVFATALATAQTRSPTPAPSPTPECPGPIYAGKEVSKKARVTFFPPPEPSRDKRAEGLTGVVVLQVVLCRSGRVTDIQPVKKMPYDITDKAVDAARRVRFIPAEKDGQVVSQRHTFEYHVGVGP